MQNCVQLMQYFRCRFIDTLLPRGSYSSRLADLPDVPKENAELSARTWALGVSRSCRHPVGIMNANHLRRCPSVTADGLPVPMLDVCPTKLHDVLLSVPTKNSKFPIKLWQLVNNSTTESIIWDSKGEGVIINQHLFERELLSPVTVSETLIDVFKATNFRSFIRQMNLYGFRKLDVSTRDNNLKTNVGSAQSIAERVFHRHTDNILSAGTVKRDCCTEVQINEKAKEVKLHHYHHPSFKKKHPELLVNVTRSKCKVSIVRVKKLMDPNKQQSNQKEKILLDVVNSSKDESMKKCDPEQVHQTLHVDYPAASPANQDNSQGKKNLDEDPVVQSIWPNSSESKETDKYFSKHSFPVSLVQNLFPQTSNAKQSSSTPQNSQLDSLRTMDHNFNYYIIPLAQFHPASSLKEMSYGYSSASFNSESTGLDQHCFSFPHYNNYQMPFPVGTQKSACPSCQCTSSCLEIMDMNLLHSQVQPKSASKEKQFSLTGINIPNNTLSQMVPIPSATPLILKNSQMSTAPKIQTDGTVCSVSEASGVLVSPLQKQSNYYSQSWVSKHCDQNNCASPSKQSLMSMKDESMTSYIYSENMNSILQSQPPNLMLLADVACSQILHDNKLYRVPVIQSTNMKSAKALNK